MADSSATETKPRSNVTKLKVMESTIISRVRALGSLLGQMFEGNRDLYAVYGYKTFLTYDDFVRKYARQDIAARIVESEPRATWTDKITLKSDPVFEEAWANVLGSPVNLMQNFIRTDKLAGLGPYCILLVGVNDGKQLDQPLDPQDFDPNNPDARKILYLQPYSSRSAFMDAFDMDQTSERYGLPTMYRIRTYAHEDLSLHSTTQARMVMPQREFNIHWTRVIHIAENLLEDSVYGYCRLQRVFNLLEDLSKITGGSAETFWLTANRGMQIDVDKDMDLKEGDLDDLAAEVDEYQHNLRRVLRTRGVKVNMLGSEVADPRGTFQVLISLISGATGIPQRILIGAEAGQLASEQDRANWAIRINERRNEFAEPSILLPFIRLLIRVGILPSPSNLEIIWPEAFKMSPLERAQTAAQKARSLANVSKALSDNEPVVTRDEGRQIIGMDTPTPIFDSTTDTATK